MSVSVVMGSYNGEKYILQQLESIHQQTYSVDEVIICDDGSSDRTVRIISDFIAANNLSACWSIVQNETNLGFANNFAKVLQLATGDYIFFSDQDDIWMPTKIEEMLQQLENNANIQLLCSEFEVFTSSADARSMRSSVMKAMRGDASTVQICLNQKNLFIGSLGCAMVLRKEFRDAIMPYWFHNWAHDEFVWKLAQCFDGCYMYHKALIARRLHSDNASMLKYHQLEKRIVFLQALEKSHVAMHRCATDQMRSAKELQMIQNNIKSVQLRIKMLQKKNPFYAIPLLRYPNCYHSKKSILVEPAMALRYLFAK